MSQKQAKQKKKLSLPLRILMVAIILVTVFLCGIILSDSETPAADNTDPQYETSGVEDTASEIESNNDDQLLVESDEINVSLVGTEDASSLGVFYVTLKIENNTDTEIVINLEDADVDGETIPLITTGAPLIIRPGNSGQSSFIFSTVDLSISTMDDAEAATFRIVARDNDTFDTVYESELVTVNLH